jgi:putative ABC transport system permease protein
MNILKLVAKNITRRKGRFVFTLLGITVGMASFVALLSLGTNMRSEVTKQAGMLGANLVIMPKNWCAYDQINILTGESLPETLPEDVLEKVSAINGVTAIPYLSQKTAIQNNPVSVTGISPSETKNFKGWEIETGNYFASQNERAAVVGSGIANQFNIKAYDTLTIRGETFPVRGILKATGSNDDIAIYLPISVVQEIYNITGYISFIAAKVDDMAKIDAYTAAIVDVANVIVSTDKQLLGYVLAILGSVNITLQMIAGVALVAAAFGIINTMMTAIYERRREIGILRAIGGKSGAIFKIFLLESGLYGLFGGVIE